MRADYVCTHCKIRCCRASSSMSGALLGRRNLFFHMYVYNIYTLSALQLRLQKEWGLIHFSSSVCACV